MKRAADSFAQVRQLLSDAVGSPRWPDEVQLPYLNDARRLLWKNRAHAFSTVRIVTARPADLSVNSDLDFDEAYFGKVCLYMAARCIGEDAEHAANIQMAAKFMQEAGLAFAP